ncbi:MAG: hypothetical protein WHS38_08120 [Thermodesulforhabdaceae bacterium]|jgi:hypothetical protein
MKKWSPFLIGALALIALSACSESGKTGLSKVFSFPDITSETKEEGRSFSNAEVRRMFIDQPYLASGDYFMKRNPEKESTFFIEVFADAGSKAKAEANEQEKRLARLEEAVFKKEKEAKSKSAAPAEAPPLKKPAEYRMKIGFIVDYKAISIKDGESFLRTAREVTTSRGLLYVDHQTIKEVLSKTDCLEKRDLACVSSISGIYPGVRFLNVVEILSVPSGSKQQKAKARISIVDTGLNYRYPSLEVEMPVQTESNRQEFMKLVAEKLVDIALEKKGIMPWFCHAFSQESQNRWFISAGSASGLQEGDILKVIPSGKIVNAPTGTPAGWVPGDAKGTVKVERIVNEELAIVSLVSGNPPSLEDYLIP